MNDHRHNMRPDRQPLPTVYKCNSCAFRCTPATLSEVEANPTRHRLVKANSPQAREIYGRTT